MDRPQTAEDVLQQASAFYAQERDADAEHVLRAALAEDPTNPMLWVRLAAVLLVQGRYREGFQAFEARGERANGPLRGLSYPEWEGAPLAGRSVLVSGEQGIGDELQFARFVPALRRLGASRISLAVRSANIRALTQIGADFVFPRDGGAVPVPKHDCWVMLGSLPHRLGLTLDDVSSPPYLAVTPSGDSGIGLVERGDPAHPNDAARSMPAGMLQEAVPRGVQLQPAGDVLDSLRRVASLDLLITVDTSWAHMAGALGVPCWLLLPHGRVDWRWMRRREDSPWYNSVRLFRQHIAGDWSGVVSEVCEALTRRG